VQNEQWVDTSLAYGDAEFSEPLTVEELQANRESMERLLGLGYAASIVLE
jgi:hypothetical protein